MQFRLEAGLIIIESNDGDLPVVAHAYMISVPGANQEYPDADVEELQEVLGWSWSDDFGWVFSCLA